MDERLNVAYAEHLDRWLTDWKTKTQLPQQELGHYAKQFDFGDKYQFVELKPHTISRTLKNRPLTRADGKYNLYCILGVLYMDGVIHSTEEIRHFLETYHITVPSGKKWQDIQQAIEEGVGRGQPALRVAPHNQTQRYRMGHLVWMLCVILLEVAATWFMSRGRAVPHVSAAPSGIVANPNGWCGATPLRFSASDSAPYYFYVSADVQLGDFAVHHFYIYFNTVYTGADIAYVDGTELDTNEWQIRLDPAWISTHPNWKTAALWSVNYVCNP